MKSILITIAISVYMTFMVVTIQVANKQTLATSDVTLDMITVMSRAFDEGGEGPSGGACLNLPIPHPYWAFNAIIHHTVFSDKKVVTVCGKAGWKFMDDLVKFEYSWEGPVVSGHLSNCNESSENYCCQLDTGWFPNEAN